MLFKNVQVGGPFGPPQSKIWLTTLWTFTKNVLLLYQILIKAIDDNFRDEKLQHNINKEAAKISVLSSRKINKFEYVTDKEMLPYNRSQMIEQAKFTYSPLRKALKKQTRSKLQSSSLSNKKDELNQIESIFPKNQVNDLITDKPKEIKELEEIDKGKLTSNWGIYNTQKKQENTTVSVNFHYLWVFEEDADKEQNQLVNKLHNMGNYKIPLEKSPF